MKASFDFELYANPLNVVYLRLARRRISLIHSVQVSPLNRHQQRASKIVGTHMLKNGPPTNFANICRAGFSLIYK